MKYFDRVKQTSETTGTGSLTLGSALSGYRAFAQMYASTDRFTYVIEEPVSGQWELGIGQVLSGVLVRETPLYGSAAVPVSFGVGTKSVYVVHTAPLSQSEHMRTFGTGYDGDVTISGTVVLSQNADYRNLSFAVGGLLVTNGWRVRVSGVCDMSGTVTAAIIANGATGGAGAAGGTAGAASGGPSGTAVGRGQQGGAGGAGGVAAGSNGNLPSPTPIFEHCNGGATEFSGAGGDGSGGVGGAGAISNGISGFTRFGVEPLLKYDASDEKAVLIRGGGGGSGGGGGGGDGTAGGGGGAGGNGGGVLDLAFAVLKVGSGSALGSIAAIGGAGGAGGSPAAGNRGSGGGGSGGGGGYCHLVVGTLIGSKAGLIHCHGGTGGNAGTKTGTGTNGVGGYGGAGGYIHIVKLGVGTFTEVVGSTFNAPSGVTGGAGGLCIGDV